MILNDIAAAVAAQLDDQAKLGVQVVNQDAVPESGPANRGLWWRIPNVTAVFADLKGSTALSSSVPPEAAAIAYTYFIRAMTVTLEGFSAGYIEIQGDGIFDLFGGQRSMFMAAACAITMRTQLEETVAPKFRRNASVDRDLKVGIDCGTLLVRQLGLKGTEQNEVWAGMPVNAAAKLSSVAEPNEIVVSDRVFAGYELSAKVRQHALLWPCCCRRGRRGAGLSPETGQTTELWNKHAAPNNLGLDFGNLYKRKSGWCVEHGTAFCEALITAKRPDG